LESEQSGSGYTPVKLAEVPVIFSTGSAGTARTTGNNAAWLCRCGDPLPLVATLFPKRKSSQCPSCGATFIFRTDRTAVDEVAKL